MGTVIFLVLTLAKALQDGRHFAWKNSSLPYLFHGLSYELLDRVGDVRQLKDMEDIAEATTVQLVNTMEGWRLVEVDRKE